MRKIILALFFSFLIAGIIIAIANFFKDGRFYLATIGILIVQILFFSLLYAIFDRYVLYYKQVIDAFMRHRKEFEQFSMIVLRHLEVQQNEEDPEFSLILKKNSSSGDMNPPN